MGKVKRTKRRRKLLVKLSAYDRRKLRRLLGHGNGSARIFRRSMILLLLQSGQSAEQISQSIGATAKTVRNIGWKYLRGGLQNALYEKPRPGRQSLINSHQEKEIIALVCSAPPGQRSRWTLELLKDQIKSHGIVKEIGRETLRTLLHECRVKPWLEKNVVHRGADRRVHPEDGGHT